jgi:hypothetical protein
MARIVRRQIIKGGAKFMTISQLAELLRLSEDEIYRQLGDEEELRKDTHDSEKSQQRHS